MLCSKGEFETQFSRTLVAQIFEEILGVVPVLAKDAY